jgi:hypothetical protein
MTRALGDTSAAEPAPGKPHEPSSNSSKWHHAGLEVDLIGQADAGSSQYSLPANTPVLSPNSFAMFLSTVTAG